MDTYLYLSLGTGFFLMVLERLVPARDLPFVRGWWWRVLVLNFIQAAIVFGLGGSWQKIFFSVSVFNISSWGNWTSACTGYLITTFIFYWWHRWRHRIPFLWDTLHQIHHSPQRIETITSFYKHPLEILANSFVMAALSYGLLGLTPTAASILTFITCIAEFLYHMNIHTPYWYGFIFQRPESHRIHHQLGYHDKNFSDLPIWDILFGTFYNPKEEVKCGFKSDRETRFLKMLLFKNVNSSASKGDL